MIYIKIPHAQTGAISIDTTMESILSSRGVLLPSQFPRDVASKITSKAFNCAKNGGNSKSDASCPPVNWGHGCSGRLQTRDLTVARTSSSVVVVVPSSASDDDSPGGFSIFLGLNFGFRVMALDVNLRWWVWCEELGGRLYVLW